MKVSFGIALSLIALVGMANAAASFDDMAADLRCSACQEIAEKAQSNIASLAYKVSDYD